MYGTYERLNVHVLASPREVIKAASMKLREECRRGPEHRRGRHQFYRNMLDYHEKAAKLYREWRLM